MKRFLGLIVAILGGITSLWAGYYVFTGGAHTELALTQSFSFPAMTWGLAGIASLTLGLVLSRD